MKQSAIAFGVLSAAAYVERVKRQSPHWTQEYIAQCAERHAVREASKMLGYLKSR